MKRSANAIITGLLCCVVFYSCKKDYSCKCHTEITVPGFPKSTSDTTFTIEKVTKKNAKSTCSDAGSQLNASASLLNGSASCSLE